MAEKPFIVVFGQSNATATADAWSWEDEHGAIALRNPLTTLLRLPQYSDSTTRDLFTLPIPFYGGPQTSQRGDGPKAGSWQVANCRGKVVSAVRFLTPYNPTPSYFNLGTSFTLSYPGKGSIGFGSTPTVLQTTVRWQYDPAGLVITRQRTGTQHTIQAGWVAPATAITIDPPMVPPPEFAELFDYPIVGGASSTTSTLKVVPSFGGINDLGSALDAVQPTGMAIAAGGLHACQMHRVYNSAGVEQPSRVVCKTRPAYVGEALAFKSNGTINGVTGFSDAEDRLTGGVGFLDQYGDGDCITILDDAPFTGALPTGISFDTPYYIRDVASDGTFRLSLTRGGAFIPLSGSITLDAGILLFIATQDDFESYVTRMATELEEVTVSSWSQQSNTFVAHGIIEREKLRFEGVLPSGVVANTDYWTRVPTFSVADSEWDAGTDTITSIAHGIQNGWRFTLSTTGTLPTGLNAQTTYHVVGTAPNTFQISTTEGGAAVNFTDAGTGTHTLTYVGSNTAGPGFGLWQLSETDGGPMMSLESSGGAAVATRHDAYFHFFVALEQGGTELTGLDDGPQGGIFFLPTGRGSITGLQVRCLTGANAGQIVPGADVYIDSDAKTVIELGTPFDNTPGVGDTYAIEPPPIAGETVPFEEFALLLPWSPFEGHAKWSPPVMTFVGSPLDEEVFFDSAGGVAVDTNDVLRFYTAGTLPPEVQPGRRYYATDAAAGAAFLSETYNGESMLGSGVVATGVHSAQVLHQEGKENPFPPGFNYPNHLGFVASYQPFDGPEALGQAKQAFYTGLAVSLAEFFGEAVDCVPVAYGGTGIAHREVMPGAGGSGGGFGWSDGKQQLSWVPGEGDNCYARLAQALRSLKRAYAAEGNTGKCVGVVFLQGEEDASHEDQANRYYVNCKRLKTELRELIKELGFWARPAEEILFIQPYSNLSAKPYDVTGPLPVTTPWTYVATVNAAKQRMVDEDPYSATFEVEDLARVSDGIHYSGAGMTELERRLYAAFLALQRDGVDEIHVCNMALANIGETPITSIYPPDGSAQAAVCALYYEQARDEAILEHPWDFATKKVALVEIETNPRTDFAFCYEYRDDVSGIVRLQPPEAPFDYEGDDFTVATLVDGTKAIFTNTEDAEIIYIAKVNDPSKWSPKFTNYLAWKLAAKIAGPIVKGDAGRETRKDALKMAEYFGAQAKTHDSRRGRKTTIDHSPTFFRGRARPPVRGLSQRWPWS